MLSIRLKLVTLCESGPWAMSVSPVTFPVQKRIYVRNFLIRDTILRRLKKQTNKTILRLSGQLWTAVRQHCIVNTQVQVGNKAEAGVSAANTQAHYIILVDQGLMRAINVALVPISVAPSYQSMHVRYLSVLSRNFCKDQFKLVRTCFP